MLKIKSLFVTILVIALANINSHSNAYQNYYYNNYYDNDNDNYYNPPEYNYQEAAPSDYNYQPEASSDYNYQPAAPSGYNNQAATPSSYASGLCLAEANNERALNGNLPPVSMNSELVSAAQYHSNWMESYNCFSHSCPGEPAPAEKVSMTGYSYSGWGEVIAAGYSDCGTAMVGWMNSPGHRDIILGDFVHIGCSVVNCPHCDYDNYWTCVLGSPLSYKK